MVQQHFRKPKLHRFRKIASWTLLVGGSGWLILLGAMIWDFGTTDHATPADCIIVLGSAIEGDHPSPVFEQRIRHSIQLYNKGFAPRLLFTGGIGDGEHYSESAVAAAYAEIQGVPKANILLETVSRTTHQNLSEAQVVMHRNNLRSAIIVSDLLHMRRSMMMAHDLGIEAVSSPTPTSMYRSWKTQMEFLLRELYFFHHYLVTGN